MITYNNSKKIMMITGVCVNLGKEKDMSDNMKCRGGSFSLGADYR